MGKLQHEGAPVEMIGVSIAKTEIAEKVGAILNRSLTDPARKIVSDGIKTPEAFRLCGELIIKMTKRMKELDLVRKAIVDKMKAAVKDAEAPFTTACSEIKELKESLNKLYTEFDEKQKAAEAERVRKELQAEEDRKAAEAAKAAEDKAADEESDIMAPKPESNVIPMERPAPPAPKTIPPVEVKTGPQRIHGVGTISVLEFTRVRIDDPKAVPEQYKVPSDKLLMDAYESGITSIPGVTFYKEKTTRPYSR